MTLKKSIPHSLCISRKKRGRGFQFYDENDEPISDPSLKKRLKELVIPPMWSDVKICKWDDGHIQAIGRDAKGRKQYIYHDKWEEARQKEKFDRMCSFGEELPHLREIAHKFIHQKEWTREKVISLLILILDETGIRIGNKYYAEKNHTYGLTTLRRKHLHLESGSLLFEFKGKSNKMREVEINDEDLSKLIKKAAELPGYEIFRYKEGYGKYQEVDSDDVNEFIHHYLGEDYSSKDFRTWVASRLAIEYYPIALKQKEEFPRKKFTNLLIRYVADELGNTPTVCRSYYIHPQVMQKIENHNLNLKNYRDSKLDWGHSAVEKQLLDNIC